MSDKPLDLVNLMIPAKPDYVGIARLTVSGIANRMGFSYDDIEDLKLAVSEACTNAVDHAYCGGEGEIEVTCNIFPNRIQIEVIDRGNSFDLDEVQKRTGPIKMSGSMNGIRERGLGLYLIKSLMDHVDIKGDNGVIVRMTKYIRKDVVENHVETSTSFPTNR
ncbi:MULTISPECIES: anti-sigma B factor RsbW [Thermoactinomyces]|jgi:serine/threonine-protein kinase RsbW|uniref:Serine-protein kinase RsbW n=1 Tax=Thermoactinomyces vulgaris TaxID=2026 RepID=A0ABS0QJY3_THEVU|nr:MULTISPECIES: anti-sigma B factor RsbW [Thermoactinomyces]KFZ39444.1 serine/threonine protein kinase [Thermoactinomyces sp. Gus2-1]KYQ85726.1 anti-sigma B factor RsbW [Thermoactinomyces sp. AS95]MBA4552671.1 anti-sigma B factor RsbW [Thermoactinomyces vulgaris]MBA4597614.1 anti-sigma B factor RsbW [Thermoactinomyces vulgaris]MBH8584451.1 anti-sigma B factor RsbW [Thermoactinomyces sp. CICC 10735]